MTKFQIIINGEFKTIPAQPGPEPPANDPVYMNQDPIFASGDWQTDYAANTNNGTGTIGLVSSGAREGTNCMEITLNNFRQEVIANGLQSCPYKGPEWGRFMFDTEYWLGISVKPINWPVPVPDPPPYGGCIFLQSHTVPQDCDHGACCSGYNVFSLHMMSPNRVIGASQFGIHSYVLTQNNADNQIPACPADDNWNDSDLVDNGYYTDWAESYNNRWIDYVFNFKQSTTSEGFMKAWMDGVQVLSQSGPNTHVHASCPGNIRELWTTFSFGLYDCDATPRTVQFDSIRAMDMSDPDNAGLGYDQVKPGQ